MYKALYRKYRPLTFADVVGQEHVTTTLQNQVAKGNVSHAYLFTGSRGTGKTTCAKILARAINCSNPVGGNPCGQCENCKAILKDTLPDVMEIDAASNNGVDYIRELRERIAFAPAQGKYRVYIIDEVHMLSTAASNALLKTLEEPPSHAVFILATTEINAILPTILSRCQRYDFLRIEPETIAKRLQFVAEQEGAVLTDDAAAVIAAIADGGMRDALSILDLCTATGKEIDEKLVNKICGRASKDYLLTLVGQIDRNSTAMALKTVAKLHAESVDMQRLCMELCEFYRDLALAYVGVKPNSVTTNKNDDYKGMAEFLGIEAIMYNMRVFNEALSSMNTTNRRSAIEMAIIKITTPNLDTSDDAILRRVAALERQLKAGVPAAKPEPQKSAPPVTEDFADMVPPPEDDFIPPEVPDIAEPAAEPRPATLPMQPQPEAVGDGEPLAEWNDIVAATYKVAPMIFSFLTGSTATLEGHRIIIHSNSLQLRNMLAKPDSINYKGLCSAISEVMGEEYIPVMEKQETAKKDDPMLSFMDRLNNL